MSASIQNAHEDLSPLSSSQWSCAVCSWGACKISFHFKHSLIVSWAHCQDIPFLSLCSFQDTYETGCIVHTGTPGLPSSPNSPVTEYHQHWQQGHKAEWRRNSHPRSSNSFVICRHPICSSLPVIHAPGVLYSWQRRSWLLQFLVSVDAFNCLCIPDIETFAAILREFHSTTELWQIIPLNSSTANFTSYIKDD